jgi:hypothetical protein
VNTEQFQRDLSTVLQKHYSILSVWHYFISVSSSFEKISTLIYKKHNTIIPSYDAQLHGPNDYLFT